MQFRSGLGEVAVVVLSSDETFRTVHQGGKHIKPFWRQRLCEADLTVCFDPFKEHGPCFGRGLDDLLCVRLRTHLEGRVTCRRKCEGFRRHIYIYIICQLCRLEPPRKPMDMKTRSARLHNNQNEESALAHCQEVSDGLPSGRGALDAVGESPGWR